MDLVAIGVFAGVLGTLTMDSLNHLFPRIGVISKIDVRMIGRMSEGWMRGRFQYGNLDEMAQVSNEKLSGYITHYAIGVGFAVLFVLVWNLLVGGIAPPLWILVYGVATTAASWFFVYPSMSQGLFGRRSSEGIRSTTTSRANRFFSAWHGNRHSPCTISSSLIHQKSAFHQYGFYPEP